MNLASIRALLDERRPGHTLPRAMYSDPEIYEFDLDAVHESCWIMVGFEVEVPDAGSTLALTVGRSPVVIVRTREGRLRGFFNSCRHRGAQICPTGASRRPRLVCPYHQWSYDLNGNLLHAGRMQASFDPTEHSLRPIHVETVAGSIYVCLADEPPSFQPFREHFEPLLAPHDLANAKLAAVGTLVEQANWKLVMENARECYHCAAKHPELAATFPVERRHLTQDEKGRISAEFSDRMAQRGLGVGPVEGDWWQASRFALNEGCKSLTMDGAPVVARPLGQLGDGDVGSLRWAIEAHSFCHAVGDHVFMFSAMPTGPQQTVVTSKWLVHKDAVEGVDYHPERLTELWNRTNDQDRELAENNQRGVNSRGYVPGPYSELAESLVLRFTDWYCNRAQSYIEANAPAHASGTARIGRVAARDVA